ncbi:MAG TPA: hypothetical protein VFF50_01545 [Candidatus Deferrimicrobiaceae bacterium]|nr:hypothetical protein [Candidatus Deferrimicrobiaceae bacterium]
MQPDVFALLAPPVAMATTTLERVIRYYVSAPWQLEQNTRSKSLRMNWVVVTGKNGNRRLRMLATEDAAR